MLHGQNCICDLAGMVRDVADGDDFALMLYCQRHEIEKLVALLAQPPCSLVILTPHCIGDLGPLREIRAHKLIRIGIKKNYASGGKNLQPRVNRITVST